MDAMVCLVATEEGRKGLFRAASSLSPALIKVLLTPSTPSGMQGDVLMALSVLASCPEGERLMIAAPGLLPRIVALLGSDSQLVQEFAAVTLRFLAACTANHPKIHQAKAVPSLRRLEESSPSPRIKMICASVLTALLLGCVE